MSALPDLREKVAVVTGGATGIGRGIAEQFRAEGMRVVIADIEPETLRNTAAEIDAVGIHTDVSDLESVRALARSATERFGTVHVICNNAGIGPIARIADMTIEDWHWMIGVNLYGVVHGVQTFLPILAANDDGGHIVNTSSIAGLVAQPRLGAYSVTKSGVVALTETLAAELEQAGSKVGATVLCPGAVRTNIHKSSRNRPRRHAGGGLADFDVSRVDNPAYRWITSREAGEVVVRAVKRGDLYALTHPESYGMVEQRHQAIAAAYERAAEDVGSIREVAPSDAR
ncbi:SDR family NAD(P)-dependent oxidoreductase [Saccharopolyspora phatthalungensis]|uniref:NAD(P)-dependent dehydrogenase (Short-subunit alcohol dehydrogenase family) n=1 Tax=Saccharopolyspora phatthalungensis TaxID=664693 RepID=A0A840Q8C2_9PSEU|nr:SDR family NAD(P)-dependent oxidoreductase [Saccharopolyspora phatthalungensis]MBB5158772.1 NAD(P)-dependent dehydrogenase (short-subunit alcohol dehydrogenase family) [Saccharopolyspora phatthalungensis]